MAVIIAGLNTFPEIFDLMEARLDSVGDGPIVQSMTTSSGPPKSPSGDFIKDCIAFAT